MTILFQRVKMQVFFFENFHPITKLSHLFHPTKRDILKQAVSSQAPKKHTMYFFPSQKGVIAKKRKVFATLIHEKKTKGERKTILQPKFSRKTCARGPKVSFFFGGGSEWEKIPLSTGKPSNRYTKSLLWGSSSSLIRLAAS